MTPSELINSHLDLANTISAVKKRNLPKCVSYDEVQSAAYYGLVDAANKWEVSRNVEFKVYATWRINGAIQDYLRELGWGSRNDPKQTESLEDKFSVPSQISSELFNKISSGLTEKACQVVSLYYLEGWSQVDIAKMLGVSKPRICEILSNSYKKIRQQWSAAELWAEVA